MTGDETPARKRGRPPKSPEELVQRPTVALRVSPELHAVITEAAKKNGRSLSQEMEKRLEEAFSTTPGEVTVKAVEAARREADEAMLASFHGKSGYLWGRLSADLYIKELMSAALEAGPENASQLSEEFISIFTAKIKDGQDDIIKTWRVGMLFSRLATRLKQADLIEKARDGISTDEEIKAKFKELFAHLPKKKEKSGK